MKIFTYKGISDTGGKTVEEEVIAYVSSATIVRKQCVCKANVGVELIIQMQDTNIVVLGSQPQLSGCLQYLELYSINYMQVDTGPTKDKVELFNEKLKDNQANN